MARLKQLIVEVHRRSIWQVLGIYLVGSWIAYEVTLAIVEGLGLPDWVPPFAIVLFIIGLPVVLATAFVQEGLPGAGPARAHTRAADRTNIPDEATSPATETSATRPPASAEGSRSHPLTWHRAITAGVLAFAALGLAVSGFMGMRAAGVGPFGSLAARGELGDNSVLVAEFEPITGDSLLARVVAEAFRVDLTQSNLLHPVDRTRIRYVLERMGRPDNTPVAGDVAREAAVRLGIAVLLEGDVGQAGTGYLLSARLVTADSGRVLIGFRETARDSTDLLPAVDRLSRRLRERAGESLRSIRANPPLSRVTTSSLPALRAYMRGRQAYYDGDAQLSVKYMKEALALDPEFASAHRSIAVVYRNWGWRSDTLLYHLREAARQEERLTEAERHHSRGMLAIETGRLDDARREYESAIALDSTDAAALINLGVVYSQLRRYDRAEEYTRRAMATGFRAMGTTYWNIVMSKLHRRDFASAKQVIADAALEHPTSLTPAFMGLQVALAESDFAAAETLLDSVSGQGRGRTARILYELLRGRPTRGLALAQQDGGPENPVEQAHLDLGASYIDLWLLQQPAAAARRLRASMLHPALDSVPAADLPYAYAAIVLAAAGEAGLARRLIERFEAGGPAELMHHYTPALLAARGFAHLAEGRPDSAVAALTRAQQRARCQACFESLRAQVLEGAGMPDSAIAAYERYIDTGWDDRHMTGSNVLPNDPVLLAYSHERAALLHDEAGNGEQARRHYASFIALWEQAEPALQPRVQAARTRLAALSGERR